MVVCVIGLRLKSNLQRCAELWCVFLSGTAAASRLLEADAEQAEAGEASASAAAASAPTAAAAEEEEASYIARSHAQWPTSHAQAKSHAYPCVVAVLHGQPHVHDAP